MKKLTSFFNNLVLFIAMIVAFHYLYQLLWAWERLWQGLVLFCLLSLAFFVIPHEKRVKDFYDNKFPLNGKFYKDQNRSVKIKWFLSHISWFIGVFFILAIFAGDAESSTSTGSEWLLMITAYVLFLIPIFLFSSKVDDTKKDFDLKKKEEKAKKKQASAEKRKLKKKLEKEKLEKELKSKKIELKGFLESSKLEKMNKIETLTKKKEKLESSITKEKETITELNNKYPFIGKIVPNRIK